MNLLIDTPGLSVPPRQQLPRHYDDLGWPTIFDSRTGEVQLRLGAIVDALTIRAGLAAEVNGFLIRHMLRVPVIVVPGTPADWIFLTQQRTPMRQESWDDLVRLNIGWKRRGETMSLPAPDSTGDRAHWLRMPELGAALPPWSAVVCAARTVSSMAGRW